MKKYFSKTGLRLSVIYSLGFLIPILLADKDWKSFTFGLVSLIPWGLILNVIFNIFGNGLSSINNYLSFLFFILNTLTIYFFGMYFEYLAQSKVRVFGLILSAISYTFLISFLLFQIFFTILSIFKVR